MGLASRRHRNKQLRTTVYGPARDPKDAEFIGPVLLWQGIEPRPSVYTGVKGWARYHKRGGSEPIFVNDPDKYLNSSARIDKSVDAYLAAQEATHVVD